MSVYRAIFVIFLLSLFATDAFASHIQTRFRIVSVGDSITAGADSQPWPPILDTPNDDPSIIGGWPVLLDRHPNIQVWNIAVGGSQTNRWVGQADGSDGGCVDEDVPPLRDPPCGSIYFGDRFKDAAGVTDAGTEFATILINGFSVNDPSSPCTDEDDWDVSPSNQATQERLARGIAENQGRIPGLQTYLWKTPGFVGKFWNLTPGTHTVCRDGLWDGSADAIDTLATSQPQKAIVGGHVYDPTAVTALTFIYDYFVTWQAYLFAHSKRFAGSYNIHPNQAGYLEIACLWQDYFIHGDTDPDGDLSCGNRPPTPVVTLSSKTANTITLDVTVAADADGDTLRTVAFCGCNEMAVGHADPTCLEDSIADPGHYEFSDRTIQLTDSNKCIRNDCLAANGDSAGDDRSEPAAISMQDYFEVPGGSGEVTIYGLVTATDYKCAAFATDVDFTDKPWGGRVSLPFGTLDVTTD